MTMTNPLRHSRPRTRGGGHITTYEIRTQHITSQARRRQGGCGRVVCVCVRNADAACIRPLFFCFFLPLEYIMRVWLKKKKLLRHHCTHGFRQASSLADWIMASNPTGYQRSSALLPPPIDRLVKNGTLLDPTVSQLQRTNDGRRYQCPTSSPEAIRQPRSARTIVSLLGIDSKSTSRLIRNRRRRRSYCYNRRSEASGKIKMFGFAPIATTPTPTHNPQPHQPFHTGIALMGLIHRRFFPGKLSPPHVHRLCH